MAMDGAGAGAGRMMQQNCYDVRSAGRRWHGRGHRVSRVVQLNCLPRQVRLLKVLAHFLQWLEYVHVIKGSSSPVQIKSSSCGAGRRCAAARPIKRGSWTRPLELEQPQKQYGRRQLDVSNHHEDDAIADCLEFIKRSWATV